MKQNPSNLTFQETSSEKQYKGSEKLTPRRRCSTWPLFTPLIIGFSANSLLSKDVHWHQVRKSLRAAEGPWPWGKRFIGCIYMALPTVNHPSTTVKARPDCSRRLCLFLAENRTSALSRSVAVHQENTSVPSGSRDFQPVSSLLEDSEGVKAETSVGKLLSFWLKTPLTLQF